MKGVDEVLASRSRISRMLGIDPEWTAELTEAGVFKTDDKGRYPSLRTLFAHRAFCLQVLKMYWPPRRS